MELIDKLKWRYATKAMNRQVIPQAKIDTIIEAISLAPTSSGLQPFEVYVITNQEVKDKIKPIAWNQSVVSDCSHLLVFAAWDTYTEERINKMFDLVNELRGFKNEGWENYRQMLLKGYPQWIYSVRDTSMRLMNPPFALTTYMVCRKPLTL